MFNDLLEILKDFVKKLFASRLFLLGVFFTCLFSVLAVRLFNLQIIEGESLSGKLHGKNREGRKPSQHPREHL